MNIIVAGAGNVGRNLIAELSLEEHDITVVDTDLALTGKIVDTYDIQGVSGNCASAEILKSAGVEKADGELHAPVVTAPFEEGDVIWLVGEKEDLEKVMGN